MARLYGWSNDVIASMTPQQQLDYLDDSGDNGNGTITFRDEKAYAEWLANR